MKNFEEYNRQVRQLAYALAMVHTSEYQFTHDEWMCSMTREQFMSRWEQVAGAAVKIAELWKGISEEMVMPFATIENPSAIWGDEVRNGMLQFHDAVEGIYNAIDYRDGTLTIARSPMIPMEWATR